AVEYDSWPILPFASQEALPCRSIQCRRPRALRRTRTNAVNFDWAIVQMAVPILGEGLLATIRICLMSILFGTVLGVILGLTAYGGPTPVRWLVRFYVDFVRGTPLLIQIFLVYFALPVVGIFLTEFWAGVTALSLNAAGFICEIVRGGLNSVER